MIFAKNADGRFLVANKTMADSLGMQSYELVGKLHADVHPVPDEVATILEKDQLVFDSKHEIHIAKECYHDSHGNRRWLQITKVLCPESVFGEPAIVGSAMDITKLRKAELSLIKALEESEKNKNKIESILKSVGDGLIFCDIAMRVVLMSASAEKIFGKQLQEVFLQPFGALIENKALLEELDAICTGEKRSISKHGPAKSPWWQNAKFPVPMLSSKWKRR